QHLRDQLDHRGIVVHDQDPALPALQGIRRDPVLLHEPVEGVTRDPSESGPGDSKSLELTGVEAANDRLLAHLADLGRLARRENGLHGRVRPIYEIKDKVPPSGSLVTRSKEEDNA